METEKPRAPGAQTQDVQPPAGTAASPSTLEYIIFRIGVPLALIAGGCSLMASDHFLFGIVVFYFGFLIFAVDVGRNYFYKWKKGAQISLVILYVAALLVASRIFIFFPAPITISASSDLTPYNPGSNMDGIIWEAQYSAMTLHIKNPSATDYKNFDAEISTDLVISEIREVEGLGVCQIAGIHQTEEVHTQEMHQGAPTGPADHTGHTYQFVPFDKDGKPLVPVSGGADWTYRIRCDEIPAKSQLDFIAALEVVNDVPGKPLFGPRRAASWITVEAKFQTDGRNRTASVNQQSVDRAVEFFDFNP